MQRLVEMPGEGKKISHLPIGSLKIFGTNPHGEPIWRVVWSDSRDYIVGANHAVYSGNMANDAEFNAAGGRDPNVVRRECGYKRYPLYPSFHAWILERWKSPQAATGCPNQDLYQQRYTDPASGLLTLGPWPDRGEYYHCFTFPAEPGATVVYEVITRILAGERYSYWDHKRANEDQLAALKKDRDNKTEAIFYDSQQAFKNRPSNVRTGKKTKYDVKIKYSAEEVGLRTKGGFHAGFNKPTRPSPERTQEQES